MTAAWRTTCSYSVVGSETDAEPVGEGFMGIYHFADATPNITGSGDGGCRRSLARRALERVAAVLGRRDAGVDATAA